MIMARASRMLEKVQLTTEGIQITYQKMQEKDSSDLLKIMEPENFNAFINQLGPIFKRWKWGEGGNG